MDQEATKRREMIILPEERVTNIDIRREINRLVGNYNRHIGAIKGLKEQIQYLGNCIGLEIADEEFLV